MGKLTQTEIQPLSAIDLLHAIRADQEQNYLRLYGLDSKELVIALALLSDEERAVMERQEDENEAMEKAIMNDPFMNRNL